MTFQIAFQRPFDAEIRDLARRQLERIGTALGEGASDEGIHDARKRLKKLRGLLRLVRAADEDFYRTENARYRDLARILSGMRDLAAQIEAVDALELPQAQPRLAKAVADVRSVLVVRRDAGHGRDQSPAIAAALTSLGEAVRRVDGFALAKTGDKAVAGLLAEGVARIVAQGRRDLKRCERENGAENFHTLRKRVKYHAMHLRLLAPLHPTLFEAARGEADALAEDIGLDHDYAVLRAAIAREPRAFRAAGGPVAALAEGRQRELQARALQTARRLFVDDADAVATRIRRLARHAIREGRVENAVSA